MTQQQFYPPQYPAYPQQPAQAPQPYAQPGYPAAPPQYGGYPPQAPQQPAVPLAQGTIDDYYSQPSAGGGPSISWSVNGMPKPEGTTYSGIVARDVTNADIQQQTDPKTGQPKFYRDGRPQFVMKVPLKVQPSQEHPEGEAVLFVRGQMRDELVRAMAAAGAAASPKGGDALSVTLVQRKPSRGGGMPQNVFAIQYAAAAPGQAPAAQAPTAPSPAVGQPQQQAPAPAPQFQPVQQQVTYQQPAPPVQQMAPPASATQPVVQQPQAQVPANVVPNPQGQQLPPGLTPDQQALFERLAGQQAQGVQG